MLDVCEGGGGGTENRARSCGSVSRIRDVISGVESSAFVKILGGGKLGGVSEGSLSEGEWIRRTGELLLILKRGRFARDGVRGETLCNRAVEGNCSKVRFEMVYLRVVESRSARFS